jgi:ABC-type phosphonate transport system ATPase subunit
MMARIGLVPCYHHEKIDGLATWVSEPTDQCYKMQPEQRWTGLWRDEFKGWRFCPAPAQWCDDRTAGDVISFDVERATRKRLRLVLMDEPLAALDAESANALLGRLQIVFERSAVPVLYVTHNRAEAERLATSSIILRGGRIEGNDDA